MSDYDVRNYCSLLNSPKIKNITCLRFYFRKKISAGDFSPTDTIKYF